MSTASISAILRKLDNPREIRRQGRVPAVVYGHGDNASLEVDRVELSRLVSSGGARGLIDLTINGDKPAKVMIKELQRDPVQGSFLHADFYRVSMTELITASVPIRVHGEEEAVAVGAILQHQIRNVDVQCLPGEIPTHLDVDLTGKGPGDGVTVGDLRPPVGITILTDPAALIVSLVLPRAVEEEPAREPGVAGDDAVAGSATDEEAVPEKG